MKKILKYIVFVLSFWILSILFINLYVLSFSKNAISKDISDIKDKKIWLVFWAKVKNNWVPSDILADRLKVGAKAYKSWKINKIIVSWDNSKVDYDEVSAMANYLVSLWVTKDDIYLDYAWFDTYDSLYRAQYIFWASSLILFTQEFHLKRAIYIWSRLWLDVFWISTDLQNYIYNDYYNRREVFARIKAFIEVDILNSKPKFLGDKVDMSKPQEELSDLNIYKDTIN